MTSRLQIMWTGKCKSSNNSHCTPTRVDGLESGKSIKHLIICAQGTLLFEQLLSKKECLHWSFNDPSSNQQKACSAIKRHLEHPDLHDIYPLKAWTNRQCGQANPQGLQSCCTAPKASLYIHECNRLPTNPDYLFNSRRSIWQGSKASRARAEAKWWSCIRETCQEWWPESVSIYYAPQETPRL